MATCSATYVSSSTFTVSGDQSSEFPVTRAVQLLQGVDGNAETHISAVEYRVGTNDTLVTIDTEVATSNLATVKVGSDKAASLAIHNHTSKASGGVIPAADFSDAEVEALQSIPIPTPSYANDFLGINAGGTDFETKTLQGTTNRITIDLSTPGEATLSTPQDTHTAATPTFAGLTLTALTGIMEAKGASAIAIHTGTALQILRRNSAGTAYEFASVVLDELSDVVISSAAQGDLLYRNASDQWINLHKETDDGALLYQNSSQPAWLPKASSDGAILRQAGGLPAWLAKATDDGALLYQASNGPNWLERAASNGAALIQVSNAPSWLGMGTPGYFLRAGSDYPIYTTASLKDLSDVDDSVTDSGASQDLLVRGASAYGRLAKGSFGEVLVIDATGNIDWDSVREIVMGTGGEALSAFHVCYTDSTDSGSWKKAKTGGTDPQKEAWGIVVDSDGIGHDETGPIQVWGYVTNPSWSWTPGKTLYLDTTFGVMTETKPTVDVVQLARAITAQTIFFCPGGQGGGGESASVWVWHGPWNVEQSYVEDDGVENDGSSYICIQDHDAETSNEPGVGASWETYWNLVVAKGEMGDPGLGVGIQDGGTVYASNGTVQFANANGVSFSMSDSIMSASIVPNMVVKVGTDSINAGTLEISNSNNISFGLSGSTLTASVAPGGVAVQAGTVTRTSGTVIFSNGNGVSWGLSDGTMTASVATAGGGGTVKYWHPFDPVGIAYTLLNSSISSYVFPFTVGQVVEADYLRFPFVIATSAQNAATITGSTTITHWQAWSNGWSLFTRGTGADSGTLYYSTSGSCGLTQKFSFSESSSSQSMSLSLSYISGSSVVESTSSFSTVSANVPIDGVKLGYSVFVGSKWLDSPFVHTLNPGVYWMLQNQTKSVSAGGSDALFTYVNFSGSNRMVQSYASGIAGITDGTTVSPIFIGQGYVTASDTSLALSKISSTQASYPRAYFQVVGT